MSSFEVGYLVGSLATASINRLLAKALVCLAPPEMQMTEIPFKDLPPYSYDYDANYPGVERAFKNAIATVDAVLFDLSRMIMIAMLRAERTALRPASHRLGRPAGALRPSKGTCPHRAKSR